MAYYHKYLTYKGKEATQRATERSDRKKRQNGRKFGSWNILKNANEEEL